MNKNVDRYYELVDEFLLRQFDFAMKRENIDSVKASQKELINYLDSLEFKEPNLEIARIYTLQQLKGLTVNYIGLPQFRNIQIDDREIENKLIQEREKVGNPDFLYVLEESQDIDFDEKGLELEEVPESWMDSNNCPIPHFDEPKALKDILFEFDDFQSDYKYIFERSPEESGFFMMTLHRENTFRIGYKSPRSLFELSTLAHEIGHTTTPRENDLVDRFCNVEEEKYLIHDERDSYRYERLFADKVDLILERLDIDLAKEQLTEILLKRKAIQFNMHLLKCHLNFLFFSGTTFSAIENYFNECLKKIFPKHESKNLFEWFEYCALDRPLSPVGYIRAYYENFG